MPFALLLAALLQEPVATPTPAADEDIVIVARREKCGLRIANRVLSSREFAARAAEWRQGTPIHIHVPAGSDYRCLAKIAFKLNDHGVTRFEFEDAP